MDYAKQVEDVARYTGTSYEESSKLIQIADDLRIEVSSLRVGFRNLNQEGIQPNVANLKKLADEYKKLPTSVDKAKFATEMFGARAGQELAKLLEASSEEIDAMAQSAQDLGLVLTEETIEATKEYYAELDNLNDRWAGIRIGIGKEAIPALLELLDVFEQLQAVGESGWLEEFTGSWWNLFMRLSYGVEPVENLGTAIDIAKRKGEDLFPVITMIGDASDETAPEVGSLAEMFDKLGTSMDKSTTAASLTEAGIKAVASSQIEAQRITLALALADDTLTTAEREHLIEQQQTLENLEKIMPKLKDGTISIYDYAAAVDDGTLSTQEMNEMLGITPERLQDIVPNASDAEAAMLGYSTNTTTDLGNVNAALDGEIGLIYDVKAAWEAVPKQVETTYTIRVKGHAPGTPYDYEQYGGPVQANRPYIVGEVGPELFVPNTPGRIIPNNQMGGWGGGGGGGGNITIHNHSAGAAALTWAMVRSHKTQRLNRSMGG
jgi:hypothetical protein